jgi:hypothetical protein
MGNVLTLLSQHHVALSVYNYVDSTSLCCKLVDLMVPSNYILFEYNDTIVDWVSTILTPALRALLDGREVNKVAI